MDGVRYFVEDNIRPLASSNVNCLLALLGFRSSVMETKRGRSLQTYLETLAVKQTISDISGRVS